MCMWGGGGVFWTRFLSTFMAQKANQSLMIYFYNKRSLSHINNILTPKLGGCVPKLYNIVPLP